MKKLLAGLFLSVLVLALAACGAGNKDEAGSTTGDDSAKTEDKVTLKIGASNTPHAVILEQAKPILAKEGIDLKIETYQDYVLPNQDLESKTIDANYFQHIPYLELQIKDNGYDFVNAGGVHIEPIGIYSKKYKSLEDLPKGATILLSNSVSDHGRMLSLLEAKGLIKLKDGIDKTAAEIKDIVDNPKDFKFDANTAPELLVQMFENEEGDAVLINSNYAIDNGLNPIEDAIALEDKESPYVNIIAVRAGDENKPEIKKLLEVLKSEEIQDFILKEWKGAVVPVK
ncbi:MetQ/NlpA family ABC transporter substrate-binding protein [Lysinibacillus sp. NPDC097279]|uniref:MetQ/NlpA family ABC transporter substrate-binding protein n=1 Tax=unclassified Lysinibacillus TaxID=2636778 RepID=UPI00117324E4|nr:MetQ/NlpA family ABC transporter substrate-binding protein [Lysinibacillus sp. CD3-6]QPQ34508.1 MetQ/NlpA family ABC transporter substrate-binding protein [Lysinibacillus sp. JNUCC-52]UED79523.1 MetQ/NlpA family ABC transporter substrate-binding protein [Lysinibacillus sp. CD3-6]